jgi:hypothetical protein
MISEAVARNPHGWGLVVLGKNGLRVEKSMDNKKALGAVKKAGSDAWVFHARITTHGETSIENCHPFVIMDGEYCVIHNGIIDSMPVRWKGKSDTYHLAVGIVEPMLAMHPEWFDDGTLEEYLESMIGHSKVVIVRASDGKILTANKSLGVNHEELWLSNTSCLPSKPVVSPKKSSSLTEYRSFTSGSWARYRDKYYDEVEDVDIDSEVEYQSPSSLGIVGFQDLSEHSLVEISKLCSDHPYTIAELIHEELDAQGLIPF